MKEETKELKKQVNYFPSIEPQVINEIVVGDVRLSSNKENMNSLLDKLKKVFEMRGKIIPRYVG